MTEANDVAPSFVVDITSVWETKMRAVAAFASQFTPAPGETGALPLDRFQEAVELVRPPPRPADRRALRRGLRDARAAEPSTTCWRSADRRSELGLLQAIASATRRSRAIVVSPTSIT